MGRERRGCGICRLLNCALSVAFLGAGAYVIWHFLGRPNPEEIFDAVREFDLDDFTNVLGNLSDFDFGDLYDNDPFLSDNTTSSWPTEGEGGLELELLNALDETWQQEFQIAADDWENGEPDSLTLTITKGDVDYSCKKVDGLQKVCSGNFGESGYLGVNELVKTVPDKTIISSVAKMNEYYLRNADNAERQFTMCHEIGHGFGLPHTDETFNNPPLGNCMDYTNKPEANMHPDITNYNRLVSIYGTVSRRRLGASRSNAPKLTLPEHLTNEYERAVAEIEGGAFRRRLHENYGGEESEWTILHLHERGATYSRSLGEEHEIEVHMLHPLN